MNMKESFFLEKSNHYYMGKLRLMLSPNPENTGIGQRKRQNRLDMTGCPEEKKAPGSVDKRGCFRVPRLESHWIY